MHLEAALRRQLLWKRQRRGLDLDILRYRGLEDLPETGGLGLGRGEEQRMGGGAESGEMGAGHSRKLARVAHLLSSTTMNDSKHFLPSLWGLHEGLRAAL